MAYVYHHLSLLSRQTGILMTYGKNVQHLAEEIRDTVKECNIPLIELSEEELVKRYPMMKFSPGHKGLIEESAGLLLPPRCLNALKVEI